MGTLRKPLLVENIWGLEERRRSGISCSTGRTHYTRTNRRYGYFSLPNVSRKGVYKLILMFFKFLLRTISSFEQNSPQKTIVINQNCLFCSLTRTYGHRTSASNHFSSRNIYWIYKEYIVLVINVLKIKAGRRGCSSTLRKKIGGYIVQTYKIN